MYASVRGYDSVVKLFMDEFKRRYKKDSATLLDYLDAENDNGDTAFTLALKNGHEDCVIVLSEYLKVGSIDFVIQYSMVARPARVAVECRGVVVSAFAIHP